MKSEKNERSERERERERELQGRKREQRRIQQQEWEEREKSRRNKILQKRNNKKFIGGADPRGEKNSQNEKNKSTGIGNNDGCSPKEVTKTSFEDSFFG